MHPTGSTSLRTQECMLPPRYTSTNQGPLWTNGLCMHVIVMCGSRPWRPCDRRLTSWDSARQGSRDTFNRMGVLQMLTRHWPVSVSQCQCHSGSVILGDRHTACSFSTSSVSPQELSLVQQSFSLAVLSPRGLQQSPALDFLRLYSIHSLLKPGTTLKRPGFEGKSSRHPRVLFRVQCFPPDPRGCGGDTLQALSQQADGLLPVHRQPRPLLIWLGCEGIIVLIQCLGYLPRRSLLFRSTKRIKAVPTCPLLNSTKD